MVPPRCFRLQSLASNGSPGLRQDVLQSALWLGNTALRRNAGGECRDLVEPAGIDGDMDLYSGWIPKGKALIGGFPSVRGTVIQKTRRADR